jgi:hypothetical protein
MFVWKNRQQPDWIINEWLWRKKKILLINRIYYY